MSEKTTVTEKIDVAYVAQLARLHLSEEEVVLFQGQLNHILEYVRELNAVNVEGVEPMAYTLSVQNIFRRDEAGACLNRDQALANAPLHRNDQFVVPKIIE